jgi:hypothetical protein
MASRVKFKIWFTAGLKAPFAIERTPVTPVKRDIKWDGETKFPTVIDGLSGCCTDFKIQQIS